MISLAFGETEVWAFAPRTTIPSARRSTMRKYASGLPRPACSALGQREFAAHGLVETGLLLDAR